MLRDLSLEQAQQIILKTVALLPEERIPLAEALGRTLAEDLVTPENLPPSPQSAVDGYAVGDGKSPIGSCFVIQGHLELGDYPITSLQSGEAQGVLTGGTLPKGSKAVVPHERTRVQGDLLTVLEAVKPGNNIKQAGEDFSQGDLLLGKGSYLDPGSLAVLAAFGIREVSVYRKPRVAIMSLGHNVVAYDKEPQLGQARDSNGALLSALVVQEGALVVACEQASDLPAPVCQSKMRELLGIADLVITSGGTYTQGDQDANLEMEASGAQLLYWGVGVMPGSHTGAAHYDSRLLLALSGNPGGCAVGYQLFAGPALRAMQGRNPQALQVYARCKNGFAKKSGSRRFVRGHAVYTGEAWEVTVLPGQKPSMMRSLISCNALIDLPAGSSPVESGDMVSVLLLCNEQSTCYCC